MPTISRFFGIIVKMHARIKEHNPPHIHAYYNEYEAEIDIRTGKIIHGNLNTKNNQLIKKWTNIHKVELEKMWENQDFYYVTPLA